IGRDNNQPTKLYGASGAMQLYRRYLENQAPMPLMLTPPEDISPMNVDSAGNFVCGSASSSWRSLPVWTTDANALCQQQQQQVQQQQQMLQQQNQQNPQTQQGQPGQQNEQKDADGVAGWIKDMFGQ
ncbi:MAG TPA: bifunctional glycosyl transferase/transpeptidase, partial [Erwinia persicina]|nr:bifunctional glycosyl transferase/transpeptidase [Erwinia persicina]